MIWIIYTLLSAFFFGLKDICAKFYFRKGIDSKRLILQEYFLLFIILLIIFFSRIDFFSYKSIWYLYLFKAISVLSSTVFYYYLLKRYEISVVSPLLNLSPIFLLFLSTTLLSEVLLIHQFAGIVLIIISTYYLEVIVHHHTQEHPHKYHLSLIKNSKYVFFSFAALLIIALSFNSILDKMILKQVSVYTNLFFTSLLILIALIIYFIKENSLLVFIKESISYPQTFIVGALSIVSTFLVLFAIAIPSALVSLIVPIRRTSTLFSSLIGGMLFHENHLLKKLFAISIMILGVILIVL